MSSETLEDYLRKNYNKGKIDFSVRCNVDSGVSFYIHPVNEDGKTKDYAVYGDILKDVSK